MLFQALPFPKVLDPEFPPMRPTGISELDCDDATTARFSPLVRRLSRCPCCAARTDGRHNTNFYDASKTSDRSNAALELIMAILRLYFAFGFTALVLTFGR